MRHVSTNLAPMLLSRPVAGLPRCVPAPSPITRLVAPARGPHGVTPAGPRATRAAVPLAAVAERADRHLAATARAQHKAEVLPHGRSQPPSSWTMPTSWPILSAMALRHRVLLEKAQVRLLAGWPGPSHRPTAAQPPLNHPTSQSNRSPSHNHPPAAGMTAMSPIASSQHRIHALFHRRGQRGRPRVWRGRPRPRSIPSAG